MRYAGLIIVDPQSKKLLVATYTQPNGDTNTVFPGDRVDYDQRKIDCALGSLGGKLPSNVSTCDVPVDYCQSVTTHGATFFLASEEGLSERWDSTKTEKEPGVTRTVHWMTYQEAAQALTNGDHHKKAYSKARSEGLI